LSTRKVGKNGFATKRQRAGGEKTVAMGTNGRSAMEGRVKGEVQKYHGRRDVFIREKRLCPLGERASFNRGKTLH